MGLFIFFTAPAFLIIIEALYGIYRIITKNTLTGHLFVKVLLLISLIICWIPFTVSHGWTVGTFNLTFTIIISIVLLYTFFTLNALLKKDSKNVIQIFSSLLILGYTLFNLVERPPYKDYRGQPFEDMPLQDTKIFILTFLVYTFTFFYFLIKFIKSKKQ